MSKPGERVQSPIRSRGVTIFSTVSPGTAQKSLSLVTTGAVAEVTGQRRRSARRFAAWDGHGDEVLRSALRTGGRQLRHTATRSSHSDAESGDLHSGRVALPHTPAHNSPNTGTQVQYDRRWQWFLGPIIGSTPSVDEIGGRASIQEKSSQNIFSKSFQNADCFHLVAPRRASPTRIRLGPSSPKVTSSIRFSRLWMPAAVVGQSSSVMPICC